MKVFIDGHRARRQESFMMCIAPAADVVNQEVPLHWVDRDNRPVQFNIEFKHGVAEVEDGLGAYLIEKGYAKKTPLIMPALPPEQSVAGLDPTISGG